MYEYCTNRSYMYYTNCVVTAELHVGGRPADLEIHLMDKRGEDFVPPPAPAYIAFSGR